MSSVDPEQIAKAKAPDRIRLLFTRNLLAVAIATLAGLMTIIPTLFIESTRDPTVTVPTSTYQSVISQLQEAQRQLSKALTPDQLAKLPPDVVLSLARVETNLMNSSNTLIAIQAAHEHSSPLDRLIDSLFTKANAAQTAENTQVQQAADSFTTVNYIRPAILIFMLGAITIFFIACIVTYFRTDDAERLKFAMNSIQTILGFYIGVFTGLLGLAA